MQRIFRKKLYLARLGNLVLLFQAIIYIFSFYKYGEKVCNIHNNTLVLDFEHEKPKLLNQSPSSFVLNSLHDSHSDSAVIVLVISLGLELVRF